VNIDAVRAELPVLDRFAYLNAGTFGPLPRRTVVAMTQHAEERLELGRAGGAFFEGALARREELRAELARLIGAEPGSVALTTSTTEGCNAVVAGLRLAGGDQVVTTDAEHQGLRGALRAWDLDVRVAAITDAPAADAFELIRREVTHETRLIALSHVTWTTGQALPIRELGELGVPVLVDGAQSAGAIPVDVRELGCDFYTVSGQKWLCGPDATGGLYVRPDWTERLRITYPSYVSWEDTVELVPWPNARRYESVFTPTGSVEGLLASLAFARDAGEERFAHAQRMAERCRQLVGGMGEVVTESGQGTLIAFAIPESDPKELVARAETEGVVIRELPGTGWLRASCGFWTSEGDLQRLVAALGG
jgi:L-cysteine/cystine lyase